MRRRFTSSNPVMSYAEKNGSLDSSQSITYGNIAVKTLFLIGIIFASAYVALEYMNPTIWTILLAFVFGFIAVMVGTRNPQYAMVSSIVYAVCEGIILGMVSYLYAYLYEGIVPTALMTTVVVFLVMLGLHSTRIIKVNQRFLSILVVGLVSVIIMSLMSFVIPFGGSMYYLYVFISAALSALFLLADFASIERCVDAGMDRSYGWVLSLSLMVTLVWVYINILRILALFARRD